jgi:hypothetical protein
MLWTPTGPTLESATSPANTRFVPVASGNLGGVARIVNLDVAPQSFTLGSASVANTPGTTTAIRLGIGQDIIVAYGPDVTHISASGVGVSITPGIGRP